MSRQIAPILTLKLVAMATFLERSDKDGQIGNLRSKSYRMVKIGENRSGGSCDFFAQKIVKKERNKAIVDIRFRQRYAIPSPPLRPIGLIACTRKFSEYYLQLLGILNDPFCCMTLLAIEWSLLQLTRQRRCSEGCSEDCQCFWMAWTTPKLPIPFRGFALPLIRGSFGPPESVSKTVSRSVQPFLHSAP